MRLVLALHVMAALITALGVTWQLAQVRDPVSRLTLGLITFVVALFAWPLMLVVALYRYWKEGEKFR